MAIDISFYKGQIITMKRVIDIFNLKLAKCNRSIKSENGDFKRLQELMIHKNLFSEILEALNRDLKKTEKEYDSQLNKVTGWNL